MKYVTDRLFVVALVLALSVYALLASAAANDTAETKANVTRLLPQIWTGLDNVLAPITVNSLMQTRQNLVRYIWKDKDPRQIKPRDVRDGSKTGNFVFIDPAATVKTLYVNSTEKLSAFTEFAQHETSQCLAIWAQGHEGVPPDPPITQGAASYLTKQWNRGCDVLIVPMPLRNQIETFVETSKEGVVPIGSSHDGLALLETTDFSAFRLFFDPLLASLNWLEGTGRQYKSISMAGVSGGGWMSVVYPALDDRIKDSVSVAGSFPFFLRYLPTAGQLRDLGDWEQTYAPFYQIASYYELYLLSALGLGRSQTLIYNMIDPCCFAGDRAATFLPKLEAKARQLGLIITSILDSTHERHDISESAVATVLERQTGK